MVNTWCKNIGGNIGVYGLRFAYFCDISDPIYSLIRPCWQSATTFSSVEQVGTNHSNRRGIVNKNAKGQITWSEPFISLATIQAAPLFRTVKRCCSAEYSYSQVTNRSHQFHADARQQTCCTQHETKAVPYLPKARPSTLKLCSGSIWRCSRLSFYDNIINAWEQNPAAVAAFLQMHGAVS